jgi:hypothetical protein
MMWTTGEKIQPARPLSDFSKNNWGDHKETREGTEVKVKTTTNLLNVIGKLKDAQWKKIIKVAVQASKKKQITIAPEIDIPGSPEAEFELLDDDEDLMDME